MPSALRSAVIRENEPSIYHLHTRVVQRTVLCGYDAITGVDYSYRKDWICAELERLAGCLACEILDLGVLQNQLHLLTRTRPDVVANMPDREVAVRWCRAVWTTKLEPDERRSCSRPPHPFEEQVQRLLQDSEALQDSRARLSNLSWLMRLLCQPIARRANQEMGTSGRFFADRFRCRRIESMADLLVSSVHTNLSPLRVDGAASLEDAPLTAAYARIAAILARQPGDEDFANEPITHIWPFPSAGEPVDWGTSQVPEPSLVAQWLAPVSLKPTEGDRSASMQLWLPPELSEQAVDATFADEERVDEYVPAADLDDEHVLEVHDDDDFADYDRDDHDLDECDHDDCDHNACGSIPLANPFAEATPTTPTIGPSPRPSVEHDEADVLLVGVAAEPQFVTVALGIATARPSDSATQSTLFPGLQDLVPERYPARLTNQGFLPMTVAEYGTLAEWTAQHLVGRHHAVPPPRSAPPPEVARIVRRCGIDPAEWIQAIERLDKLLPSWARVPVEVSLPPPRPQERSSSTLPSARGAPDIQVSS